MAEAAVLKDQRRAGPGASRRKMIGATADWNSGRRFGTVGGSPSPRLVAPELAGLNLGRGGR